MILWQILYLAVLWAFIKAFYTFTMLAILCTLDHHEATVFGWNRGA